MVAAARMFVAGASTTTDHNASSAGEFHTETYEDDSLATESNVDDESVFSGDLGSDDDVNSDEEDSDATSNNSEEEEINRQDETIQNLAKRETSFVRMWRTIVISAMVLTGALLTTGTYLVLRNQQRDENNQKYYQHVESARKELIQRFAALRSHMRAMSLEVTGVAQQVGVEFPFITIPLFEVTAHQMRERSGLETVVFSPLVEQQTTAEWIQFSQTNFKDWYSESIKYHSFFSFDETTTAAAAATTGQLHISTYDENSTVPSEIWYFTGNSLVNSYPVEGPGPYLPIWLTSPPPFSARLMNMDTMHIPYINRIVPIVNQTRDILLTEVSGGLEASIGTSISQKDHQTFHESVTTIQSKGNIFPPHCVVAQPVWDRLYDDSDESKLVGLVSGVIAWDFYVAGLMPEDTRGIFVVLSNSCGQKFTYLLNGLKAIYYGEDDLHDSFFDDTRVDEPMLIYRNQQTLNVRGHCVYTFSFYASSQFYHQNETDLPMIFTILVSIIFIATSMTFCMYDGFVRRRNAKVLDAAAESNAIISSLFPTNVRDRLFEEVKQKAKLAKKGKKTGQAAAKSQLKNMITNGNLNSTSKNEVEDLIYEGKPIADLFPETTILFADIAGFTAWSSVREPSQVFILLETLYHAFDEIAKSRRVFKVETVGDCYVAVTGLPDPRKDHAVAMCRFARECLLATRRLVRKLEIRLGPDTADLAMRMGIHSGPVTAGVLRGERSRFQLFGDTMNTAARMEHTGIRDRIQLSQETTDLLIASGKTNWISRREDVVHAKGKGEMQTYWLEITKEGSYETSSTGGSSANDQDLNGADQNNFDPKTLRLIEWNVDVLLRLLKQIVARRKACPPEDASPPNETYFSREVHKMSALDEVKEIIALPKFRESAVNQEDPENIELPNEVAEQLHDYVCNVAAIYHNNSFHNFEHASHVTMSVVKLLSRIVAPNEYMSDGRNMESTLHDHTYGITSDPLTQFATVFSALIHDADHAGVSNAQLVKEKAAVALQYRDKSVLEQNSVDLAWNLLMNNDYRQLRSVIYQTDAELKRFRQLVVNSVMATDIVDKELKTLRNLRWDRAFASKGMDDANMTNRKATIVIEHLIQASDVAHTMQHWHIYRKWNERFFMECYQAFKAGRAEKDPSIGWYEGEIGFFDFYIIPLARKLKECGVFGVSSDEYLNYAVHNRQEWQVRGQEIVDEMLEKIKQLDM